MAADRRFERQAALRAAIEEQGLDALLVTHIPNIRYLTGFSGSAALLLVRRGATILITDFRYAAQAPCRGRDVGIGGSGPEQCLGAVGQGAGVRSAGGAGHRGTGANGS